MRGPLLLALAVLAWPVAAPAQSAEFHDWLAVCDNTRTCRAAGYSAEGSQLPVSVLVSRAAGPGRGVVVELQLGPSADRGAAPASVLLTIGGRPAGTLHVDHGGHAELPAAPAAALLKAWAGGLPVAFASGRATWRLSGDGAVEALAAIDDAQGRSGRPSALVHKGTLPDADVASPMSPPRLASAGISTVARPGDAALAVRVLAAIQSNADCPLLDDGAAQARARLWHLDDNRLLLSQPCKAAGENGYWLANLRPPYEARALTTAGAEYDGSGTVTARETHGAAGDCGSVQAWTWNGFRMEPSYAATGGLCRGVKAGGAWELPTLVNDVVPGP